MTHRNPSTRWASTTSQRIRALLAMGAVLGLGATGTMALWSDSSTATSGAFTTGTVDINLGDPAVDADPPQFTQDLAMANMAPNTYKDAVLHVSNSGTLPIAYSVASVGTDSLAAALTLSVYSSSNAGECNAGAMLVSGAPLTGPVLPEQPILAAGTSRDLCFRVTLPKEADSSFQGQSATLRLTFEATNA